MGELRVMQAVLQGGRGRVKESSEKKIKRIKGIES